MNKEEILLELDVLHKIASNGQTKNPNISDFEILRLRIGNLMQKIEAPCVQDNASN